MTKRQQWKYLFLIVVILIAACVETDIFLPAFPDMIEAFSSSKSAIQSLVTWNFVGICLSCPFYGPLSDAFGRKKPLMVALSLFLLGSILTLFAVNLDQMLWGRVLQGLGSGGCFTLGTAIIFDAFQKEKATQAVSSLNTIIPIIMAGAPLAGAYLNQVFGFRSNFIAIALLVLISFIICLFSLNETLPQEKRTPLEAKKIAQDFKAVLTNVPFWQLTLIISFMFGGYIAFVSGTPVLFMIDFGVSKALFPIFQVGVLGAWVVAGLILNRIIIAWGQARVKKTGALLALCGAAILALAALFAPRNPYILTCGMMTYAFGANWVIGLYFPEAMEILPHIKGITASLLTSARLLLSAFVIGLTSLLYNGTSYPLIGALLATIAIMTPLFLSYEKQKLLTKSAGDSV